MVVATLGTVLGSVDNPVVELVAGSAVGEVAHVGIELAVVCVLVGRSRGHIEPVAVVGASVGLDAVPKGKC